jgi:hypothetical protein
LDNGTTREERVRPDLHMLVHRGQTAEDDPIANLNVSSQRSAVGEYYIVTDDAVVCDMRVRHEEIVVTDSRDARVLHGAAIDRATLSKHVSVANLEACGLAIVFLVLRRIANGSKLKKPVVGSDSRRTIDDHVRTDDGARTDLHVRADDAEGPHGHIRR